MILLPLPIRVSETARAGHALSIHQRVTEQLRRSNHCALRHVSCLTSDDVVCLIGSLPSNYLKQVAQEIAWAVEGVCHVVNRIEVRLPNSPRIRARGFGRSGDLWIATSSLVRRIVLFKQSSA